MDATELTTLIKSRAATLGFAHCGICAPVAPTRLTKLDEWLAAGFGGQMHYIADRRDAYADPNRVLEGVKSLVMLGMQYSTVEPTTPTATQGRVARYAWGNVDYHDVIREKLHELADYTRELVPGALTRGVVDTAPLLEREFAQLAGLGWVGKNTLLLSKHAGSYFFLAALLTDVELEFDSPHLADHCGTCTACLDACPTQAFPQPYVLDATRCISYLTIELQDTIPIELRPGMGDWVFGCDVCQEVCPWNRSAPPATEEYFSPHPDLDPLELLELFELDDDTFRHRFRHTPLWRSHRRGLLRNAAIVLGNRRDPQAVPALARGLSDNEPLVRGAAAWALGQFRLAEVDQLLHARLSQESDVQVIAEFHAALERS
jgi:epoxyqueuosine reductase